MLRRFTTTCVVSFSQWRLDKFYGLFPSCCTEAQVKQIKTTPQSPQRQNKPQTQRSTGLTNPGLTNQVHCYIPILSKESYTGLKILLTPLPQNKGKLYGYFVFVSDEYLTEGKLGWDVLIEHYRNTVNAIALNADVTILILSNERWMVI